MPWYIALSGSITIILVCIYKKINIGITMIAGAVALGLLVWLPANDYLVVIYNGLWNSITILFCRPLTPAGAWLTACRKNRSESFMIPETPFWKAIPRPITR